MWAMAARADRQQAEDAAQRKCSRLTLVGGPQACIKWVETARAGWVWDLAATRRGLGSRESDEKGNCHHCVA